MGTVPCEGLGHKSGLGGKGGVTVSDGVFPRLKGERFANVWTYLFVSRTTENEGEYVSMYSWEGDLCG
jgi:hypothetical protein